MTNTADMLQKWAEQLSESPWQRRRRLKDERNEPAALAWIEQQRELGELFATLTKWDAPTGTPSHFNRPTVPLAPNWYAKVVRRTSSDHFGPLCNAPTDEGSK